MSIREIPKAYLYTCDLCGISHRQEGANGHYSNSRPPHWSQLTLARDAYDFQGAAVADGTIKRLLCESCTIMVGEAINAVKPPSRASAGDGVSTAG